MEGEGPITSRVLFLGEAPGQHESFKSHRPFTGKSGELFTKLLKDSGIDRDQYRITNTVRCNPPDNRDPSPEEIAQCSWYLDRELEEQHPSVIVAVGRIALQRWLPTATMEMVWGIPQTIIYYPDDPAVTIFSIYHPASGLHNSRMLPVIHKGIAMLGDYLNHGHTEWRADTITPHYQRIEDCLLDSEWFHASGIGVDTEDKWGGTPLYVQLSMKAGEAVLVDSEFETTKDIMEKGEALIILHNAPHDLDRLHQLDIHPARVVDTMVMAYLLGDLPQGLKPLAYRLCGMNMVSYQEVIGGRGQDKAGEYLELAAIMEWPSPDPVLEFNGDQCKVRKPQNIVKKINRALKDTESGKDVDLQERWRKMEGREVVEAVLGEMPGADLRDVDPQTAITYSCRDADATRRIYPILKHRIKDEGLERVLEMDMGVVPMIMAMQRNGFRVDLGKIHALGSEFQIEMDGIEQEIAAMIGYRVNPGSSQQVAAMMEQEKIVGNKGRQKAGSTSVEVLEPLRIKYPVIGKILDWRQAETLKSMFTDTIPLLVKADGCVHSDIQITRTITGRLATKNPNLMAFPTRTKKGKAIREAFIASDGYVLASWDYCLVGSTHIITSRGEIPIKDIRPGDGVLSVGESEDYHPPLHFNTVLKAAKIPVSDPWLYEIGLEDGSCVRCTGDHQWRRYRGGWVKTVDLRYRDRLSHVRTSYAGKYPTWYIGSNRNYQYKHTLVAKWRMGPVPRGMECDHRDGDNQNWKVDNLQFILSGHNHSQGGRRYWRAVKGGKRSDIARLTHLRVGLRKRRSYIGKGNPNWGKRRGEERRCANPSCGRVFYRPPSRKAQYCSAHCYHTHKLNHKVAWVVKVKKEDVYQITVERDHNYVLANGLVSKNSQIEMRMAAHCSQDPIMSQVFMDDLDIHSETASRMFHLPIDQLDSMKHRYPAKRIGFGILYGISAVGLLAQMEVARAEGWTEISCQELIDSWLRVYQGVAVMMNNNKAYARRHGEIRDMFGRRRLVPEVWSSDKRVIEEGLRYAINAPIQMGAQGVIKTAMANLWRELAEEIQMGIIRPIIQIHDDLVFEIKEGAVDWVVPLVESIMATAVTLSIPTPVEPKTGPSWGSLTKFYKEE